MIADAFKLSVYFGDSLTAGPLLASDALMACFARHRLTTATLLRGIEGFGINRRIQAERFPDVSTDLPLLAVAVDARERVRAVLDDVDRTVARGLVTLEQTCLATGDEVRDATFPDGPGNAAKLTISCAAGERAGRQPAYRAAVAVLRDCGASGATVLPGVDGLLHGTRRRARLFSTNAGTPLAIVSIGREDRLRRALAQLAGVLTDPIVMLERITQPTHDGELPRLPPSSAALGVWQAIQVFARRTDQVHGRTLHSELVRCLREAGAAGATTILGEWGFGARDERPYGDRLGRVMSHRPTCTVYVDRPEKVEEVWPLLDALIAGRGIVTSQLIPGYRERSGATVHGRLETSWL